MRVPRYILALHRENYNKTQERMRGNMGFLKDFKDFKAFRKAVDAIGTHEEQFGEWTLFEKKPNPIEVAEISNLLIGRLMERVSGFGIVKDVRIILRDRKKDMNAIDPLMKKEFPKTGWTLGVKILVEMLDDANLRIDGELQEGVEPTPTEI